MPDLTPAPPPPSVSSPKPTRRVKPWHVAIGISIGWKVVVLTLGAAVPRWVIGDGLDLIPTASRVYAQQAKVTAMTLWDHPLERLGIVRALRVTRVDSTAPPRNAEGETGPRVTTQASTSRALPGDNCHRRSATVVAYTYFAIPYSQARTVCDTGVVEYRLFRRRS